MGYSCLIVDADLIETLYFVARPTIILNADVVVVCNIVSRSKMFVSLKIYCGFLPATIGDSEMPEIIVEFVSIASESEIN